MLKITAIINPLKHKNLIDRSYHQATMIISLFFLTSSQIFRKNWKIVCILFCLLEYDDERLWQNSFPYIHHKKISTGDCKNIHLLRNKFLFYNQNIFHNIVQILVCLLGEYNIKLGIQATEINRHQQDGRNILRAALLDFNYLPNG
jgi:hypothetical protein